jgi:hypothetical protein
MRYEDQQLIREYCRLGLAIATAKNPETKHDVSEADTLKRGYMLMRARMEQLSPKKKAAFRAMLQGEIDGVRELIAKAKASGEDFSLADIEVEMKDLASGETIPDRPNVELQEQDNGDTEHSSGSNPDPEQQTEAHAQASGSDDGHQGTGGDRKDP